ncbi:protein chiffon isoform X1 [Helicoverpa armigera]|uniref:protein chiffon isoform X1 n=2 Tax=Helicoverpa armigera TaxID=29058 RepID=UPI0030829C7F
MVSTLNLDEKYNRVRRNFCFYLDIQDHGLARSISRRIQDMGLQQEVFLTSRVTHVVRSRGAGGSCAARWPRRDGRRADAMLQRVRPDPPLLQPNTNYIQLTVQKAISLLDKLYDTFFTASRKAHVTLFTKHFIKIEFLDKLCRPIYKEFDEWPEISLEPDPPKEKKKETPEKITTTNQNVKDIAIQKMTRKSRPRIKEREEKEAKGGYCEMCNTDYEDAALHRRSPHHLAFVRDHTNFLALDSLIGSGADVSSFLDKATPLNGERRSLRKICNGDVETPKSKRSKRSQSPDSTVNGNLSPRRNGHVDEERKHNTRCSKRQSEALAEDRQYYKVVGVSTKLRSSGGFSTKRKDSPPTCNGTKPLVVKFRKVRRSELSVLSDEAEQFMFPKRASSTSSTSSDDDDKELSSRRRSPAPPPPPPASERRRQARPVALKEESSEEDSWPEDKRRRKKRAPPVVKRGRRVPCRTQNSEPPPDPKPEVVEQIVPAEPPAPPEPEVSPLREEPVERCMKWEDGKLKYTPAVEQLEFAFECVPHSEPWFETFKRQDEDKVLAKNIPQYFALYSKSPKLPYEIGQLPPLKPNCCPLSDLVKREEKPGPSRSYGTRGMKKQKIRKRTAALLALEGHPRKSPREHASTLAILGSAGLVHRRKHADDTKSTASEDTISDTHSNVKVDPVISETQEASERLQQFLSEVFEDAADYDVSDEVMDGDAAVTTSTNMPDVSSLVSECENCDLIRNEIKEAADKPRGRRGKFKKKNRTGWPNKKKQTKKDSRTNSVESENKVESSLDRSSAEPPDDDTTQDTISEEDTNLSETEKEEKTIIEKSKSDGDSQDKTLTEDTLDDKCKPMDISTDSTDKTLQNLKLLAEKAKAEEKEERKLRSETEDKDNKKKKRTLHALGDWLQPVVRVARVDPSAARRLRSAARARTNRFR